MGRASPPLIWTKSKRTAAFFGNPSLNFNTQLKSVIISDLGETLLENLLLHHPTMSEPPDGQGVEHGVRIFRSSSSSSTLSSLQGAYFTFPTFLEFSKLARVDQIQPDVKKNYNCNQCDYSSTTLSNLKTHMLV